MIVDAYQERLEFTDIHTRNIQMNQFRACKVKFACSKSSLVGFPINRHNSAVAEARAD